MPLWPEGVVNWLGPPVAPAVAQELEAILALWGAELGLSGPGLPDWPHEGKLRQGRRAWPPPAGQAYPGGGLKSPEGIAEDDGDQ